ncbi:unnamed protein product [Parajaminaea phylloscopi]
MSKHDVDDQVGQALPYLSREGGEAAEDEKDTDGGKRTPGDGKLSNEKTSSDGAHRVVQDVVQAEDDEEFDELSGNNATKYDAQGNPIIRTGYDVSRHIVDVRDDGDPALTFRSLVLGTIFTALSSAITMIYIFKPAVQQVSALFLQLLVFVFGVAWAKFTPNPARFDERLPTLAKVLRFTNCGQPFRIKEHVVASLIASSGNNGLAGIEIFAVERLYYNKSVSPMTAVLGTFSMTICGFVVAGLLRPLIVYPAEMVYWTTLPQVSLFQNLHFKMQDNREHVRKFSKWFTLAALWEVFPSYIVPWFNGLSIFCLASMGAPNETREIFTRLFGGASSNEGLGVLNFSLDWQYITSTYLSLPLKQQVNSWIGVVIGYIAMSALYYGDVWNAKTFPFMSTALFTESGSRFKQLSIMKTGTFEIDREKLAAVGTPRLTASTLWNYFGQNLAIGAMITHVLIFYGPSIVKTLKHVRRGTLTDPHYQAMRKYKEVPMWWYGVSFLLALVAGIVVNAKGDTTLPVWGFFVSLALGGFIAPFSCIIYGLFGSGVGTNAISKMVAGAVHPYRPVANLYFAGWSHQVILLAVNLANWLKVGQYTKVPHRVMFGTQIYASLLGAAFNYIVMDSIVTNKRDVLLNANQGDATWISGYISSFNSAAITWSLAKDVYSFSGQYWLVPMGLLLGLALPVLHWAVVKVFPRLRSIPITTPLIPLYFGMYSYGNTSWFTSTVVVALVSQLWLRRYRARWYNEWNYLVGAALDGGSQTMIFVLSFALFGAGGPAVNFPTWWGNPSADGNAYPDHCLAS